MSLAPAPAPLDLPVPAPLVVDNPLQAPPQPANRLWEKLVDTIDDNYPIERNQPPSGQPGQAAPGIIQSFALVLPPPASVIAPQQRRWVGVSVRPNERGYAIEVSAYVETRDELRGVDPDAAAWRPLGRDAAEEQRLLREIAQRVGRVDTPVPALSLHDTFAESQPVTFKLRMKEFGTGIVGDYVNYYSLPNLAGLTAAFGVGAALANTDADQEIRQAWFDRAGYQTWLHNDFAVFGKGQYMLPAMGGMMALGLLFEDRPAGGLIEEYGERGIRAALVGAPPMLLMQVVTGGSRPTQEPYDSHWRPFQSSHGVSGDAFIGGLVFMSAAKMTDRPVLKASLYTLSVFPAVGRVNDSAHYPSQAFLGLCMAYAAVTAVDNTYRGNTRPFLVPWVAGNATGLGFEFHR
ncbi:MAG: hypothetical protein JSS27_17920 [Planctomycetes bacterium]|nr:hypothetical protein [Planctomycetota bacterium]